MRPSIPMPAGATPRARTPGWPGRRPPRPTPATAGPPRPGRRRSNPPRGPREDVTGRCRRLDSGQSRQSWFWPFSEPFGAPRAVDLTRCRWLPPWLMAGHAKRGRHLGLLPGGSLDKLGSTRGTDFPFSARTRFRADDAQAGGRNRRIHPLSPSNVKTGPVLAPLVRSSGLGRCLIPFGQVALRREATRPLQIGQAAAGGASGRHTRPGELVPTLL